MNPPWDLIPKALVKLKEDKATVLACLPVWPAKHWWRQVLHIKWGQAYKFDISLSFATNAEEICTPTLGNPFGASLSWSKFGVIDNGVFA